MRLAGLPFGFGHGGAIDFGLAERVADLPVADGVLQGGAAAHIERFPDGADCALGRGAGFAGDDGSQFMGAGVEGVFCCDFGDKTDAQCGCGGDAFVIAEEGDAQNFAKLEPAGEADGFERSDHAEGDVRVEELRVFRADKDIGLVQPVEGAAGGQAVHCADDRLPDIVLFGAEFFARVNLAPDVFVAEHF